MPRKCCTMWNGEACRTNYEGTKDKPREKGTCYSFPKPPDQDCWLKTLPNKLTTDIQQGRALLE